MTMNYQERSEFTRLKQADAEQGKRIAELTAENERLRTEVDRLLESAGWWGRACARASSENERLRTDNERLRAVAATEAERREDMREELAAIRTRVHSLVASLENDLDCGCY